MFENALRVSVINVSGFHFMNENEYELKKALSDGVEVRFLCALPDSEFLVNIERLEIAQHHRGEKDRISSEIYDLISKFEETGMEISFYTSSYRLPFVLVDYKDGTSKCWLTVTLPPYKSTQSFVLHGVEGENEAEFIEMVRNHFETIWNSASVILEDFRKKIVSINRRYGKINTGVQKAPWRLRLIRTIRY